MVRPQHPAFDLDLVQPRSASTVISRGHKPGLLWSVSAYSSTVIASQWINSFHTQLHVLFSSASLPQAGPFLSPILSLAASRSRLCCLHVSPPNNATGLPTSLLLPPEHPQPLQPQPSPSWHVPVWHHGSAGFLLHLPCFPSRQGWACLHDSFVNTQQLSLTPASMICTHSPQFGLLAPPLLAPEPS